ncbi:MAG: hypothetical protein AAF502_21485 [Bacteroidota bacterium]
MKKMMYIVIGILSLLVVLVLTGRKSVHHEIIINAYPEQVWEVLSTTGKYPEWNPVMQLVEGDVKFLFDFSQVNFKQGFSGSMMYGRSSYDFEDGTLTFIKAGQVIQMEKLPTIIEGSSTQEQI